MFVELSPRGGVKEKMHDLHLGRFLIRRFNVRLPLLISFAVVALLLLTAKLPSPGYVFPLHFPPKVSEPTAEQLRALPNNDKFLFISLKNDGSITVNNDDLSFDGPARYQKLTAKLREFFEQRLEMRVLQDSIADREDLPLEKRVERSALIIAPPSAKYGDVVRMIDAVKASGFDDLWVQIDGTDFWWINQAWRYLPKTTP